MEANEPDVAVGESIALHVEVRGTGYTDYASSEIVISYDNAVLTFDEFGSNLYGATIVNNDGTLTLEELMQDDPAESYQQEQDGRMEGMAW